MSDNYASKESIQSDPSATDEHIFIDDTNQNGIASIDRNANPAQLSTEQQQVRAENQERLQLQEEQRRRRRLRHIRQENFLYDISYYGYISSWAFLIAFLIGRITSFDIICLIGVIGSLVSISSSMIASEFLMRIRKQGNGVPGIITMVVAATLAVTGLAGLAIQDNNITTAGVLGLFVWSFFPSLVDFIKNQGEGYQSYEYDDNGNVIPQEERDEPQHAHYISHTSSLGGYSVINEVFGIPQPQDPPPIEISRDDMYDKDDEKWRQYIDLCELGQDRCPIDLPHILSDAESGENANIAAERNRSDDTFHRKNENSD